MKHQLRDFVACLAAPITVVATLSGNIAPHIGISQAALLIADAAAWGLLVLILAMITGAERHAS